MSSDFVCRQPLKSAVQLLVCCSLIAGSASVVPQERGAEKAAVATSNPAFSKTQGLTSLEGRLFVGTSRNDWDPTATQNDVFVVDPLTDTSESLFSEVSVWGATADIANQRVLFTRGTGAVLGAGAELYAVPFGGGQPTSLGIITFTASTGVFPLRTDGLAISEGLLYSVQGGTGSQNGFYSIDWDTLHGTPIRLYDDQISGIDADPETGLIYGVNDTTRQLVTMNTDDGTFTNVAPYPSGIIFIQGLAVSNGLAFLVTGDPGIFPVYDLEADTYLEPLTSPFTASDLFAGGAVVLATTIFSDGFESGGVSAWTLSVP